LYVYRVLLTGIHLMRTGHVEANLVRMNAETRLPHVADLIARKLAGPEQSAVPDADVGFHRREYERLVAELEAARDASSLPESPTARPALNDLLVRIRLATAGVPDADRVAKAARLRELLDHIAASRMTPAPGTPDSTEMLREDRER